MVTLSGNPNIAMLRARARRIRLVVSDVEGVLTDARVYYSHRGEEMLAFSRRDGLGFELLESEGLRCALISGDSSRIVAARATKLRIRHCFTGVKDKLDFLPSLERSTGIEASQIAYIGDDVNDARVIAEIRWRGGLGFAPSDACDEVRRHVHGLSNAPGGHGAFREIAEYLVELRRTTGLRIRARAERETEPPVSATKLVGSDPEINVDVDVVDDGVAAGGRRPVATQPLLTG